jgi:hypothetical protein
MELNLELKNHNLELNDKLKLLEVELNLDPATEELSSSSIQVPETFTPQDDANPTILKPELSSTSNAGSESVSPLLEPKNLRKGHFHIGQKNNSEKITRFKVGDRVRYVGGMVKYKGKLGNVTKVCGGRYICDFDGKLTEQLSREELEAIA